MGGESQSENGFDGAEEEEVEIIDADGQVFLMKPKKKTKAKNSPGVAESARRGAIRTFQGALHQKGLWNESGKLDRELDHDCGAAIQIVGIWIVLFRSKK